MARSGNHGDGPSVAYEPYHFAPVVADLLVGTMEQFREDQVRFMPKEKLHLSNHNKAGLFLFV